METLHARTYWKDDKAGNQSPCPEFSRKMLLLAKAYARWDRASMAVHDRIERIGWDAVYDAAGFNRVDTLADRLAGAYNRAFKTKHTGTSLLCCKDLNTAYFIYVNAQKVTQ